MEHLTRIVAAFTGEEMRRKTLRLLALEGLETAAVCTTGAEVIRTVRQMGSAAVICGFRFQDMTADAMAADLRGLAAVMVVAKASYLDPGPSLPPHWACCWTLKRPIFAIRFPGGGKKTKI